CTSSLQQNLPQQRAQRRPWTDAEQCAVKSKLHKFIALRKPSEDPDMLLQRRPITSPILLVESADLLLAVGTMPLITLPKEMIHQAPLILMGCYYTFHLTYSRYVATLLSIIQTEVLK
ncbi:hypothetical protein JZ751_010708, partial [Albula glossodonta]